MITCSVDVSGTRASHSVHNTTSTQGDNKLQTDGVLEAVNWH